MKAQEIRNMTLAEIEQKLFGIKEELFKMRSEITSGRVERPSRFRILRRDVARCYTILKEKKSESDKI